MSDAFLHVEISKNNESRESITCGINKSRITFFFSPKRNKLAVFLEEGFYHYGCKRQPTPPMVIICMVQMQLGDLQGK